MLAEGALPVSAEIQEMRLDDEVARYAVILQELEARGGSGSLPLEQFDACGRVCTPRSLLTDEQDAEVPEERKERVTTAIILDRQRDIEQRLAAMQGCEDVGPHVREPPARRWTTSGA